MSDPLDLAALTEAQFGEFYAAQAEPLFTQAETERQEGVGTFRRRMGVAAPAALLLAIVLYVLTRDLRAPLVVGAIALAAGAAFAYAPLASLSRRVKLNFLTALGAAIGVTYVEKPPKPAAADRCLRLNLLPGHDRAGFEDQFAGARHGCTFEVCEVHLESEHTDKDGNTSWTTVFRGKVIRVAFPKSFLGVTVVRRDAGLFNALRGMGALKRVGLGDTRFEKLFEVYSNDQVEARYLVHPVFMERLMALEDAMRGKNLRCAFQSGDLLLAVEAENQFEIGDMFKPLNNPARARLIMNQIAGVLKLIDAVLTAEEAPLVDRS